MVPGMDWTGLGLVTGLDWTGRGLVTGLDWTGRGLVTGLRAGLDWTGRGLVTGLRTGLVFGYCSRYLVPRLLLSVFARVYQCTGGGYLFS